jgi:hypothetical protein
LPSFARRYTIPDDGRLFGRAQSASVSGVVEPSENSGLTSSIDEDPLNAPALFGVPARFVVRVTFVASTVKAFGPTSSIEPLNVMSKYKSLVGAPQ